ncbi:DNA polymerase III subunit beta [Streptosporangium sp. NPDC087985]|uniref:DNA polymerase III subunit beta n=1 Tax=Streptosporangium sp. NPDC087985 TaxID=3366196 RepID=UPI00381135CC
MKLSIDSTVLADAVGWAAHALPNRPSVPVLAGLLLDAGADGLTLSAFDYDTSRRTTVSADVSEPGRVLLPGRILAEVVKALPGGRPVDLVLSGTEVAITCGSSEFVLLTMPVEDYPKLPELPEEVGSVDAVDLAAAVAQVVRATSKDDTLPMLMGIRVDITGDGLTLAATDRYRLVSRDLTWEPTLDEGADHGVMIPGRLLHDITRSLPSVHRGVALHLSEQLAAVSCEGRTTTVRLLEDQFIDYKTRLGEQDYTIWAEVDVAELAAAVKRVALLAERSTPVRLTFGHGLVTVEAGGSDLGRASEVVAADLDGAELQIAFNPPYLLDGLAGVEGKRARIGMQTPIRPGLIVGTVDDPDYRYLIMPIRLSS